MNAFKCPKTRITSFIGIIVAFLMSNINVNAQQKGWSIKAPLETGRGFVSGAILDGKIYLTGGFTQDHSATPSVEVYDPAIDSWTRKCDMPEARCAHATCTWREKIYVFGGVSPDAFSDSKDNVYEYDPERDEWTEKKSYLTRSHFVALQWL
jgi:N-acetylneuraminic acid mutarotase